MFGIGMNEFLLIVLLALVLIGPKQLPEVARGIGKLLVAFRRATSDLRHVVSEEINAHPEYRELSKLRDEISGDIRGVGESAQRYIDKELDKERALARSVEQDVHAIGGRVRDEIAKAGEEGGEPKAKLEPAPVAQGEARVADVALPVNETLELPPDRTEFDKAYRKFYSIEEPAPEPEAVNASAPAGAESPEDAMLREREADAAAAAEQPGHFLLRSGGGGRGGPYTFSPTPPPKPPEAGATEGKGAESEPSRAAGGDKA